MVTIEQVKCLTPLFGNGSDKTKKVGLSLNEAMKDLSLILPETLHLNIKNKLEIIKSIVAFSCEDVLEWKTETLYRKGNLVTFGNLEYIVIEDHTSDTNPSIDTANYELKYQIPTWTANQLYEANTALIYEENTYIVLLTFTSSATFDDTFLELQLPIYQKIYDEIVNYVAWHTYNIYLSFSNVTDTDNGLRVFTGDSSEDVNSKLLYEHSVKAENRSEKYKNRLIGFVKELLPESGVTYRNRFKNRISSAGGRKFRRSRPY